MSVVELIRLLGQFQTSLIFFTKRFRTYKTANQTKTKQQNKIKGTKNNKGNNFRAEKLLRERKLVGFGLIWVFVRAKSFRKKNKLV